MFLTTHVLTGGLIGLKVQDPALEAVTAFSSHIILDSLPHFGWDKLGDNFTKNRALFAIGLFDASLALTSYIVLVLRFPDQWPHITIGMFFAALPDLIYIPRDFLGILIGKRFYKFHGNVQWGEFPGGIVLDGLWLLFILHLLQQLPI
jgi:hypothetical protein